MKFEQARSVDEFLGLTRGLHPRGLFVPPLRATVRRWAREGVRLFVVRDGAGSVVARTTLHRDAALDAKLGARLQLFGLTEFTEDERAVDALFDGIEAERRRSGLDAAFGPVALLPNQTGGVVTSGFAERGFVDSPWNPAHYPAAYEARGFTPRFAGATWICPDLQRPGLDPDTLFPDPVASAQDGLLLHQGDPRRLADQLPLLRTMLNASFAQRGYYTEISAEQLARQTDGLAWLLDRGLLLYLTRHGEPVSFVLCVPDIAPFVAAVDGNLGPLAQVRLLATRRRHRREAVLVVKGTVPSAQGRGYQRLLARELLRNLRAGGYTTLRSTFVEQDNPASAAPYRAMGGRPLHGIAFYQR